MKYYFFGKTAVKDQTDITQEKIQKFQWQSFTVKNITWNMREKASPRVFESSIFWSLLIMKYLKHGCECVGGIITFSIRKDIDISDKHLWVSELYTAVK